MNAEQRRIQCWDIDAGYAAAHEKYRVPSQLTKVGYQELDITPLLYLLEFEKRLDTNTYVPASELLDTPVYVPSLHYLYHTVFGREISGLFHQYFQSEFAPVFCSMLKMGPMGQVVDESFCWHVDIGPGCHLELIIFLNDDHDGATAVMSREDSRKFIDAGYLEQERLFHLDDFASEHGISYKPYKVQPKAGSGLIFEPPNVLHKGMYPTFGERRVFQIGIIPWGKPWESFYEEHWAKGYTNSNGFPRYEAGQIA